ncbi:MAG: hypothetical protein CM1200mP39_19110 [Dehalococcoidia bacterium]|nr:MAG: hypothetical protein CM1200mP39_19110 [Dehalococcoidia bacterium]
MVLHRGKGSTRRTFSTRNRQGLGSTLTLIPEEFRKPTISLSEVCDVLEGAILKRKVSGRPDGVAIIAEGIASKLNVNDLRNIAGIEIPRDKYGNIRLADLPLARILRTEVERGFKERGEAKDIVDLTLGYELRSAPPIPFDIDYTRTLGHGAVRFLLSACRKISGLIRSHDMYGR